MRNRLKASTGATRSKAGGLNLPVKNLGPPWVRGTQAPGSMLPSGP
jgi:hypothetical protein